MFLGLRHDLLTEILSQGSLLSASGKAARLSSLIETHYLEAFGGREVARLYHVEGYLQHSSLDSLMEERNGVLDHSHSSLLLSEQKTD